MQIKAVSITFPNLPQLALARVLRQIENEQVDQGNLWNRTESRLSPAE